MERGQTEEKRRSEWDKENRNAAENKQGYIEMGREATSKRFEGGWKPRSNQRSIKRERQVRRGNGGGTGWRVKRQDREEGKEGRTGRGGGEEGWDLCMIICSLGRTLTVNFLSTSWFPDPAPPPPSPPFFFSLSLLSLSLKHPPPPQPRSFNPTPHPICLDFSFSPCQRHRSLIIESLLSNSKTERKKEGRERDYFSLLS